MPGSADIREYSAPILGKVSEREMGLIAGFGVSGINQIVDLMTTPGKYRPKGIATRRNIANAGQLQELLVQLEMNMPDHLILEEGRLRIHPRTPKLIFHPWYDYHRAVMAKFATDHITGQDSIGTARLLRQPDIVNQLFQLPPLPGVSITPIGLKKVETGGSDEYRLPDAFLVDADNKSLHLTAAYNFEPASVHYAWRDGTLERRWLDDDIAKGLLSLAVVRACGFRNNYPFELPTSNNLDLRLIVAEAMTEEQLSQSQKLLEEREKYGYSSRPTSIGFSNPINVSWFILNIMAGRLKWGNDWSKYFRTVPGSTDNPT